MEKIKFREAKKEDVPELIKLVERLKRLNEEFDPLFKVRDDISVQSKKYLETAVGRDDRFILLAESNGKIYGLLKAELRESMFYEPRKEGAIIEFYLMPELRHGGIGKKMLDEAIARLKKRGVKLVTAEFPTNNKIAIEFYTKQGFRPIVYIFGKAIK